MNTLVTSFGITLSSEESKSSFDNLIMTGGWTGG